MLGVPIDAKVIPNTEIIKDTSVATTDESKLLDEATINKILDILVA